MVEEVKIKLIFANDNNSAEISTSMATTMREIKCNIMENHWPATLADIDTVERIRLFAGGAELGGKGPDDTKSLKDTKFIPSPNFPTPVHVQPVLKSAEVAPERETAKPSTCLCSIL
mmetsp:Transcript_37953/g.100393  ORF Transcript_37953/g.100393 Transcript_37953/m.100393 type:complete len:117 (-) Transcript_37953:105-455(-)